MKKMLFAFVLAAACVFIAPSTVKADKALDAANNFANAQADWYKQQVDYYTTYQTPVMTAYGVAMTNQYSQALAASYQANMMAQQEQARAAANMFQLATNQYAHQTNINTQYNNLKDVATYNMVNNWDQSFYANQEMVLKTYAMMFGQYPFPQVQ